MLDDESPDKPSKSERKRQMLALQKIGEQLLEVPEREWSRLGMPENLVEALQLAGRIKSREGKRRQLQYVGKLMRQIDTAAIEAFLQERQAGHQQKLRRFHALEKLRDALIEGDAEPEQVLAEYPQADRSQLAQLVRGARKEQQREQAPRSARKLFRYLRELEELQEHEAGLNRDA